MSIFVKYYWTCWYYEYLNEKFVDTLITPIYKNNSVWQPFYTMLQQVSLFRVDDLIQYLSHKFLHITGIIPYVKSTRICPKVIRIGPCNFRTCILSIDRHLIMCTRRLLGITFIRCAHSQKTGKPSYWKGLGTSNPMYINRTTKTGYD